MKQAVFVVVCLVLGFILMPFVHGLFVLVWTVANFMTMVAAYLISVVIIYIVLRFVLLGRRRFPR